MTIGRQVGLNLGVRHRLGERLSVEAGYVLLDVRNLRGERLIPSLEDGSRYHDVFLRVRLHH